MIRIDPTTKNGLVKKSSIDCFQIRSVSVNRFVSFMGATDPEIIVQAQQAIAQVVGTI
jgi:mRNA interferase MazF